MTLSVVILAAGQGTRMRSSLPKVLHPVAGEPMLRHVVSTARALEPEAIHVVHGHGGGQVQEALPDTDLHWIEQAEQLGTGDAVRVALPAIPDDHQLLVLCGDVPLITAPTLRRLLDTANGAPGLLTIEMADPTGYGRILRDAVGHVAGIVEEKDASDEQRTIREVNTGLMTLPARALRRWIGALTSDNAQGEFYLTDVIGLARRDGETVHAVSTADAAEVQGVNNRVQLAVVERAWQARAADALMRSGVTLTDPARFDLRGELVAGQDCLIEPNCVFEGRVELGDRVTIESGCVLRDCTLADDVHIAAHTVIEGARLQTAAAAGPFARIRPGADLGEGSRVGNFVEMKKASLGAGSKVNHLSYVGDAEIGAGVNVGAGTITCNYDGVNKHRTVIEDGAFIGSDTQLIAPVRVGRNATIGAGTSLRRDAPADALTLTATRQRTVHDWQRPTKDGD